MQLETATEKVVRSGVSGESAFKIATNAHAFDILSSKIYTDPLLAIVRELSTNASDAQVEAGNADTPFEVHLPTSFDPYFSIRDFGTGLSEEDVYSIYTTYFESTRNKCNAYTGALGLGSKSPFAYAEQFTVTSYYNGTMTVYSMFKNEERQPAVAKMLSYPTDKKNGLEIKIPTKNGDVFKFTDSATKVYQWFRVRPITNIPLNFAWDKVVPSFSNDNWKMYKASYYSYDLNINVIMGQVDYKVNTKQLDSNLISRFHGGNTIYIQAPIGAVTFVPSREELQYDKKTLAYVNSILTKIVDYFKETVEEELKNATSNFDRVLITNRLTQAMNFNPGVTSSILVLKKPKPDKGSNPQSDDDYCYIGRVFNIYARTRRNALQYNYSITPGADSNRTSYYFIHLDIPADTEKMRNRLYYHLDQCKSQVPRKFIYVFTINDMAEFKKEFGECDVKLSDLPDPPKDENAVVQKRATYRRFIKLASIESNYSKNVWESVGSEIPKNEKIYCIRRDDNYTYNDASLREPVKLVEIFALMNEFGESGCKIYGIAHSAFDRLKEKFGMIDVVEFLEKSLRSRIAKYDDHFLYGVFQNTANYYHNYAKLNGLSRECTDFVKSFSDFVKTSKFREVLETCLRVFSADVRTEISVIRNRVESLNYLKKFVDKYPLITKLQTKDLSDPDVIDYIKLKEK